MNGEKKRKSSNVNLNKAIKEKNDEFYTRLEDIEAELAHYKEDFRNKVVYCNCDDPRRSNFYKYFHDNFHELGLKRLISSCFISQEIDLFSDERKERAVYVIYDGDVEPQLKYFRGDGDFRSKESIDLLKTCDVVVTNPPFSLFRDFVRLMLKHDRKFLVVGNMNAYTYYDIFHNIRQNKMWIGFTNPTKYVMPNGQIKDIVTRWFTTIKRIEKDVEVLTEKYDGDMYPTYNNYDAINVDKLKEIPIDYKQLIGVPISFLDKWNAIPNSRNETCDDVVTTDDFEIITTTDRAGDGMIDEYLKPYKQHQQPTINHKRIYKRIIIKKRNTK